MRKEDLILLLRERAEATALPPVIPVALALAESGLRADAERWAVPGHNFTEEAKAAIAVEDWDHLQSIIDTIVASGSKDISFGPFQQTYWYARERARQGWDDWDQDHVRWVRGLYFSPRHAADEAIPTLKAYWERKQDPQWVLERWNRPNGEVTPGVRAAYAAALRQAEILLAEHGEGADVDEALTDLWFAIIDTADYNEEAGIVKFWKGNYKTLGSPVGPEHPQGNGDVYQAFTNGIVRWTNERGAEIL